MGWKRRTARHAVSAAWRAAAAEPTATARADTSHLPETFDVDADWRRVEDGRAARLDARTTIEVTRAPGWEHVDPREVDEAGSRPGTFLGLTAWAAALGGAWWLGRRRGSGPLGSLHRPDPWI